MDQAMTWPTGRGRLQRETLAGAAAEHDLPSVHPREGLEAFR